MAQTCSVLCVPVGVLAELDLDLSRASFQNALGVTWRTVASEYGVSKVS